MRMDQKWLSIAPLAIVLSLTPCGIGQSGAGAPLSEKEAQTIATEAYIYGYPLITMDMTRRVMTNMPSPMPPKGAPMGQFANLRQYPTADFKTVTAPNADTLYSAAWLDLAKEPFVLHIPDLGTRYYLMPMLSAWTNVFADPGKRTGVSEGDFAVTGPDWKGTLPEGVQQIKAPTNMVWIIGRIYCSGTPEDYKAVHALQDKLSLVPLSEWGKSYTPPKGAVDPSVNMKTPPRDQVNAMEPTAYFNKLAMLMKDNPPAAADAPVIARMARIGVVPGQKFDLAKLDPTIAKAVQTGYKQGLSKIVAEVDRAGKDVNGWQITLTGDYGTQYLFRAAVAFAGLGANRAQDACYPMAHVDAAGQPLDGANRYVWHFASKDDLPPVNGFWSLTMYDSSYFFVPNPLNRYTLSERNHLKQNPDGSIDMYIQKDNPGPDKESNWLPAPDGKFILCLRMYWPKEAFLHGIWEPPAVTKQVEPMAAAAGEAVTATWTVQAVDAADRTVTLKAADGSTSTYKLGPEVRNFDQIHVGDEVRATVTPAVAVHIGKAAPPGMGEGLLVGRAPKGTKPAGIVAETASVVGKIEAVNSQDRTVTLQGVTGESKTLKVGPNVDLESLQEGDSVVVREVQAIALNVQPGGDGTGMGATGGQPPQNSQQQEGTTPTPQQPGQQ